MLAWGSGGTGMLAQAHRHPVGALLLAEVLSLPRRSVCYAISESIQVNAKAGVLSAVLPLVF